MPERESFLRMICDHPDDDGPRLVYADWLEEQGDTARSEFIRLQCECWRLPKADRKGRARLTARYDELAVWRRESWLAELPKLPGVTWGPFQRGFVQVANLISAEVFLQHAEAIFAASPIRLVWFTDLSTDGAKALAATPTLARVQRLAASRGALGDEGIAALVRSPYLMDLKHLIADRNGITDAGADAIARSKYLTSLEVLFVPNNQIGDSGAETLASSNNLPNLQEVYLTRNNLRENGIAALRRRWGEKAFV